MGLPGLPEWLDKARRINLPPWVEVFIFRVLRRGMRRSLAGLGLLSLLGMGSVYGQSLPPPSAYYPLDGDVLDHGSGTNNGVNHGGSFVPAYVSAEAAQFDGSSYAEIPKSIGTTGTGFTISFWVKTTDTGGGPNWYSGEGLVDGEVAGVTTDLGTALVNGKFALGLGQPDTTVTSTNAINDGQWHHVAGTWDMASGVMKVYVDGVFNAGGTGPTGNRLAPASLRIGSIQTGVVDGFLNGAIDELRLYNSVLTAPQIAALSKPNFLLGTGTVAYWPFNVATNLGADVSGLGNNLTVTGGHPVYSSAGKFGGALYLDGGSTLASFSGMFPAGLPTNASPFSLAVWEKVDTGCPNNGGFIGWGIESIGEANNLRLNGPKSVDNYWWGNDFIVSGLSVDPMDGDWHSIIATWDGFTNSFYVDAINVGSRSPIPLAAQNANFIVGRTIGDVAFKGWMEDLLVVNRPLTPPEIAIYQAGNWSPSLATIPARPTAEPSSTVFAGTTVTLNVSVVGTPPFQYQWQKDGTNLAWGTSATLVLTNAMVTDSGAYSVEVGNVLGTNASPSLNLVVNPFGIPIFSMQPAPSFAEAYQNGLVTFTAAVGGSPPIALQWQQDGTNLPGETLSSLSLANLQTNNSGTYTLVASNAFGITRSSNAVLAVLSPPTNSSFNVLTYHNDNFRSGANSSEFLLAPANVNTNSFGKLFTQRVDGAVYAQPLYVAGLNLPGKGTHNVVFVATQHGSVYAFDADSNQGTESLPLWQASFINPAVGVIPLQPADYGYCPNIPYEECIESTPVIDLGAGLIYLEAVTRETTNGVVSYVHRLHALNISTGAEAPNSPVVIQGSVAGTGGGGDGTTINFNAQFHQCRTALLLQNGIIYFAYSSQCDSGGYDGWVMAYQAGTLKQVGIYNDTPNGSQGGIWQGGGGMVGDPDGGVYAMTGNGSFSTNYSLLTQYNLSDSFLKFTNGLTLADYFAPYNQASLSGADLDISAGSPMGLPDSAGSPTHPHLLTGCGKDGTIYLLDRDNLGHFNRANDSQIVQELPNVVGTPWSFPVPAYFNNTIYYNGNADVMRAFHIANAVITPTPVATSTVTFGSPGGNSSISANGTNNGVVWALQTDGWGNGSPAVLHAYNAANLAELYNSSLNPNRDYPGPAIKWTVPTVANGKVYVGAEFALSVYGNGVFLPPPVITPAGGVFTNSISVSLSDTTPGTTIYYTLDGTLPTTNSLIYTTPLFLTNSTGVHAMATQPGAVNSSLTEASFVNSSSVGTGTGLTGAYYASQNQTFNGSPTLVRVDPTINFNWSGAGPDPSVGQTDFTARWTGSVQPQFDETYTFYATADDGVRLWINGQELVNGWVNEGPTTYTGTIALKAQQLYNLQMDYFQAGGGAMAELQWSSPSTTLAVVPQTQLYPYSNPPPVVELVTPVNGASFRGGSSITLSANAAAQYNALPLVAFYANHSWLGNVTNNPYTLTAAGLAPGNYTFQAVATDGSGLTGTSAPVNVTITAATGLPYGLTNRPRVPGFFNLPPALDGALPPTLSQVGVFSDTPNLVPAAGLIPYAPNTPLWSDGAVKSRWLAVPYPGGLETPDQQISFAPTGSWSFPSGTVFVKHFAMVTDETNPDAPLRRLETRLLVRDPYGAVYGVTYKWRPDNSDADLLTSNLNETITITNASGTRTQTWYYPSPSDCLKCHTPVANYVLGLSTRQLNGRFTYPASGVVDNQLRTLNHLGMFNPAFDEDGIINFAQMVAVTNPVATLENRFRSYIDANCGQCHQPSGPGPSFDARYDTPLGNTSIIYGPVIASLGVDNAHVVNPADIWRSMLYQHANSLAKGVKMPPLAHNLVDSNAMAVVAAWINSLSGTPALPPPVISPAGGTFGGSVLVSLQAPDSNAMLYYTLDGSLPTTASIPYTAPFALTNSGPVVANAFESGFTNSVAATGLFTIQPPVRFTGPAVYTNGTFQMQLAGVAGKTYVLQGSTNLSNWVSLNTNIPATTPFNLTDPTATNLSRYFYRAVQQP